MGSTVDGDYTYRGNVTFRRAPSFPDASVTSDEIAGPVAASKVTQSIPVTYFQEGAITSGGTYQRDIAHGAGTIKSVKASVGVLPGSGENVTIDFKIYDGVTTSTSALSSVITIDENDTINTPVEGTINAAADEYSEGAVFEWVIAVSGTTAASNLTCSAERQDTATT